MFYLEIRENKTQLHSPTHTLSTPHRLLTGRARNAWRQEPQNINNNIYNVIIRPTTGSISVEISVKVNVCEGQCLLTPSSQL